ncbi:hypothetical protein HAX54_046256 [Datura stramonium]|uniref:Uncharacterized protein n=1 Tax=Datura stramonium TaxID=4076 RepID=A0ABS8SR55_DATST|nr:hypothetical protein [Datura stramonium]
MAEMVDNAVLVLPALLAPRAPSPPLLQPSPFYNSLLKNCVLTSSCELNLIVASIQFLILAEFSGVFLLESDITFDFDEIWPSGYGDSGSLQCSFVIADSSNSAFFALSSRKEILVEMKGAVTSS